MRTRLLTQLSHAGAKESYPASPSMAPSHLQLATGYTPAQFASSFPRTDEPAAAGGRGTEADRRRAVASGGFPRAAGSVDTGVRDTGGRRFERRRTVVAVQPPGACVQPPSLSRGASCLPLAVAATLPCRARRVCRTAGAGEVWLWPDSRTSAALSTAPPAAGRP